VGDDLDEGTEVLYLRIHTVTPGGVGIAVAQGVILDDDASGPPPPPPGLCQNGVSLLAPRLTARRLGGTPGDESLGLRGRLDFAAGAPSGTTPLQMELRGAQIRIEDLGSGLPLLDLTQATSAIPAGLVGSSPCGDLRDGWKVNAAQTTYVYSNRSGLLPPFCAPGSAQVIQRLVVRDRRAQGGGITVKLSQSKTTLPAPSGPVRATIVLGADAAGSAGACAVSADTPCTANAAGTAAVCR
jgi:hypothetical protein